MLKQPNWEELLKKRDYTEEGFIELAYLPDSSVVRMPYILICGKEDGPVLVAEAGNHGEEYYTTEAITHFARRVDKENLRGTVIALPCLNFLTFAYGIRINHVVDWSCQDMHRCYPGDKKSFLTKRIVAYYHDNILSRADYLVTFHDGGNCIQLSDYVGYPDLDNGGELTKKCREMAFAFGAPIIYDMKGDDHPGIFSSSTKLLGLPSIMPELGGYSNSQGRDETIKHCSDGILNVMRYAGMIDGEMTKIDPERERVVVHNLYLRTNNGGILKPRKTIYDDVKAGEVLSEIYNVFGEKVDEVIAPKDGIVSGYWSYPMVQPGHWTVIFGAYLERNVKE